MKPIVVYTGSQVWEGRPEIRPSRKGRAEHGPGLYFTTHLTTARKYAKGRGMRRKDQIWKDVVHRGPLGTTRFSTLVNLMVNYDALTGKWGPALAEFLAVMGIGASHVTMSGTEDWVMLFDTTKILRWQRVSTEESEWELPSVRGRI